MKKSSSLHRLLFILALLCTLASAQPQPHLAPLSVIPALSVNATANQHAISPYIYGMNFANQSLANELGLPVNRWGGNATSRYNWQNDISNHASDWYFENIKESNTNESAVNRFIEQNQGTNTETLLTVPLIGYVSNNDDTACGFSIAAYGAQTDNDWEWRPDCGNGISTAAGNPFITGNDPLSTSVVITQSFVSDWANYLVGSYGDSSNGGVRFYNLDNEPGLWHETHRDVHPDHLLYQELVDLTYDYAAAIKAVDSGAQILGPVQDGWARYFYASYTDDPDTVAQNDRDAHGGKPFVQWYLEQLKDYEDTNSVRLIDYFDLHYYPQAPGVSLSPAGNSTTQALRLRSTRALWDPTYVDESWIANTEEGNIAIQLIPRMQDWVDTYYPGTKLAISEYNWGALDHINGALAQADVLGIFGREGLDLATLWDPPITNTQPGFLAFRMYLNYDGAGSTFGETSVSATSTDQSQLAIYAATRSGDGALTLMIINKTSSSLTSNVTLTNFTPFSAAQGYRYSTANLNAIQSFSQSVGPTGFSATFPANSITLLELQPNGGTTATPTSTPTRTNTPVPPTTTFTPTNTLMPSTATFTPTNTLVPPTATYQVYLPSMQR